jgi:cytosine permease
MKTATSGVVSEAAEDRALEPVPLSDRKPWWTLSWNTVGIVTTLVALYIGALLSFVAGVHEAMLAGLIVALVSSALGWGMGHIAYMTGRPSGVLARYHGFGVRGSMVISSVFGFMMIGFLAAENALLYQAIGLFLGIPDTWTLRAAVYGALATCWVLLTTYGFNAVTRFSSLMLVGFLTMLAYLVVWILHHTHQSWWNVTAFGTQLPQHELAALGVHSATDKIVFCINVLAGSGGALALLAADIGRYARRSADIGAAVGLGALTCCVGMVLVGGVIMYASVPLLIDHLISTSGASRIEAIQVALRSPEKVATAFVLIGGGVGVALVVAAQSKAQVINTYSSALSLANVCDALFEWRPGRVTFVIFANLLSLLLLGGDLLRWFNSFLETLGILTTCFAAVILADYFIVRRLGTSSAERLEPVNWAGMVTIAVAFVASRYLLNDIVPIKIVSAVATAFVSYPLLRLYVLRPAAEGL